MECSEQIKIHSRVRPELPSEKEVEDHYRMNHVPFRAWCEHCIKGKAGGNQHRKIKDAQETVPTISMDYAFMTSNDEKEKESKDSDKEEGNPILIMIDRKSGRITSHVLPAKGVNEYSVKRAAINIRIMGYSKVTAK